MKNIFICLVFVASLIVSPLAVFSQDETVTETPEIVLMELSGVVVSVDLQEQQIGIEYQLDDLESATTAIFDLSETVEILKQKGKKPSPDWLEFVKTNMAREHIRQATKRKGLKNKNKN